jgi:hypothetical protein
MMDAPATGSFLVLMTFPDTLTDCPNDAAVKNRLKKVRNNSLLKFLICITLIVMQRNNDSVNRVLASG